MENSIYGDPRQSSTLTLFFSITKKVRLCITAELIWVLDAGSKLIWPALGSPDLSQEL